MATKTFDEFVETIQESYAMDINDYVDLYSAELDEDEEGNEIFFIYGSTSNLEEGNYIIHKSKNETIEFNEESRAFSPTAYDQLYEEDRVIAIRPLVLI